MTARSDPAIRVQSLESRDLPYVRMIQRQSLEEPTPRLVEAVKHGIGTTLVAVRNIPVGYVIALAGEQRAYVAELAVESAVRRQGIGQALLDALIERALPENVEELHLTVRADDERARSFYRAYGFEMRERLPEHFETGSKTGLYLVRSI